MFAKFLRRAIALIIPVVIAIPAYLFFAPPDLLRVGTNYSAKIVCSSVFISGRDADEVLAVDVQAPGHPLLRQISIDVDEDARRVNARIFGFFAPAVSQYRAGLGCTNTHDAVLSDVQLETLSPLPKAVWPQGNGVAVSQDPAIEDILGDQALLGDGFRAAVVVHNGRIIGEAYGDGFDADMPLLGWSMTKTVTAALLGTLMQSGDLVQGDPLTPAYPAWADGPRNGVQVADMLAMASGLEWDETYGDVSDVTRMLYLEDDMAGFAAGRPLADEIGAVFNYSSGTTTALSRYWQTLVGEGALTYPQEALFAPLGMTSAVMETDAVDTFVGSSYMYATARDWARFGQFLLQGGVWNGQQLLPESFTDWMFAPVPASDGDYANGHIWLEAPRRDEAFEDAVWLQGHDGQSVGIFPSHDLVIVRLGLSPSRNGYSSLPLAQAVIAALPDS